MISRIATLVIGVVLMASACSSSTDTTAEPSATSEPTVVPTSVPDPTPITEAEAAPTTAPEPEPTSTTELVIDDEAAVRDVHTRFMTELRNRDERLEGGPEAFLEAARELTTGPVLARIEETVAADLASGERVSSPGYLSNIVDVQIDGDTANVVDCSQDRSVGYDASGEVSVPADAFFKLRATQLVRIDGRWFVEEFFTGGDERCEPPDDS